MVSIELRIVTSLGLFPAAAKQFTGWARRKSDVTDVFCNDTRIQKKHNFFNNDRISVVECMNVNM